MRLAQTQVWPLLRYLDAIGAVDRGVDIGIVEHDERRIAAEFERHLLTVLAHCCISSLPTSVEPVKVNLRTSGWVVSSLPIGPEVPVTTDNTPLERRRARPVHTMRARNTASGTPA